jgi:hypothetical protein
MHEAAVRRPFISTDVCLLVNTRPARDADVFSDYTGTILQASIIIPSTRPTFLSGLGQNPTRGPTATHHLSLPGLRYKTLLTTCQKSSPVEVWHMRAISTDQFTPYVHTSCWGTSWPRWPRKKKTTVTGFRCPRACRIIKYQFENRSWELRLPTLFKNWFKFIKCG